MPELVALRGRHRALSSKPALTAGFVIPNNPYNAVELTFTFPVTSATLPAYCALAEGLEAGSPPPLHLLCVAQRFGAHVKVARTRLESAHPSSSKKSHTGPES